MAFPLLGLVLWAAASCAAADSSYESRAGLIRSESLTEANVDAGLDSRTATQRARAEEAAFAGDGSKSAASSRLRDRSWATATVRAMGFADTCQNLFWAGWVVTGYCRDKQMPEYDLPSCRCMRAGTAWPAKYCSSDTLPKTGEKVKSDSAFASQDVENAVNVMQHQQLADKLKESERQAEEGHSDVPSLLELKLVNGTASSGSAGGGDFDLDIYGGCDICCERKNFFYWGLIIIPISFLCCCACCLAQHNRITRHNRELQKKLEAIQDRMAAGANTMHMPHVPQMPHMPGR